MATFTGTSGNDTFDGEDGQDTIFGGAGDDTLAGGDGADSIRGGSGNDIVSGGAGEDRLFTEAGNDTIEGGAGRDTVDGGSGNDVVYGGDDNDLIAASNSSSGDDTAFGGAGNDVIYTGNGADTAFGGTGADRIFLTGESNTAYGGDGDDRITNSGVSQGAEAYGGAGNDTISAYDGAGNADTFYGGAGNDSLHGLDGDDQLYGGAGNDNLQAGEGADTLRGGAGDDRLIGGGGNDTFVREEGDGDDVVTDFDIGDDDGDGKFNDQIDVSELRNPDGSPVTAYDVVVTDDGSGSARLTFPGGETLVLQGVSPDQINSADELNKAGIPCFVAGTRILTPQGERRVEDLRAGDLVATARGDAVPIVWQGHRAMTRADLDAQPELRPIVLAKGALGGARKLMVSPQHGVLAHCTRWGRRPKLVRARHLARLCGGKVRVAKGVWQVTYVHLLFDQHQIIFANGRATESFYPGPWGLRSLGRAALQDVLRAVPRLGEGPVAQCYGPTALDVARFAELPQRQVDLEGVAAPQIRAEETLDR